MSTTNILDLNNRIDELEKNSGGGGSADSAKRSDIATEFSATTAYTAGCFVYYEGKLYQFNADHAAGAWDPTDVVEANVTDQVVSNASAIAGLTASDVAYDNTTSGMTATDVQSAVDEVAGSLVDYAIVVKLSLASAVSVASGVIDLAFPLPSVDGYKPICAVGFNYGDRGLAASTFISGVEIVGNDAHIFGSVSQNTTFTTGTHVNVLYIRNN